MFPRKISVFILVLVSGCASAPKLDPIPKGETVSIVVSESPSADGQTGLKNDAMGKDIGVGAGGGAVSGGLLGLLCGPWAPLCVPTFSAWGAVGGAATGAVVSVDGGLSAEQATQLHDRILRLNESQDKVAQLATNINDQAARYWDLNSTEPQTTVRVWVQDLIFASTHGDQVRAILQVSVMVINNSDKPLKNEEAPSMKLYESASPYASLDNWLDDESDIADTSISSAIQQISNQILSDLAISFSPDKTVQTAKIPLQLTPGGASSAFEFYGEAEEEINTGNYDKNLWAKAFVDAEGNEQKRKSLYIELRANELYANSSRSNPVAGTQAAAQQKAVAVEPVNAKNSVTGVYVSEITTNAHWVFDKKKHRSLVVRFEQNGNNIIGTCSSANMKIVATREGDDITFYTMPSDIGGEVKGKWKVSADGSRLEGKWTHPHGDGKWNLRKIE